MQVLMIALVSLLFITAIPIDCKITSFSLYLHICKLSYNLHILLQKKEIISRYMPTY